MSNSLFYSVDYRPSPGGSKDITNPADAITDPPPGRDWLVRVYEFRRGPFQSVVSTGRSIWFTYDMWRASKSKPKTVSRRGRGKGTGPGNWGPGRGILRVWHHPDHGRITSTTNDLARRFGFFPPALCGVLYGRRSHYKGWRYLGVRDNKNLDNRSGI